MTDGINTDEFRLYNSIRTDYSDVRLDPKTGHMYIRGYEDGDRDGDGDYNEIWFAPHLYYQSPRGQFWRDDRDGVDEDPDYVYLHGEDDDHSRVYFGLDGDGYRGYDVGNWTSRDLDYAFDSDIDDSSYDPGGNRITEQTVRLKYDELYDRVSLRYHAYYHKYAQRWRASDYYDFVDDITWTISGRTKDTYLHNICGAAKNYGVTIYTIGFEVTNASALVMEDCASSPAHFYRVAGEEIGDAFRSIARQVNELRLIH